MFVDGDDYLPSNSIDTLLDKAYSGCYDIVEGSYQFVKVDGSIEVKRHTNISGDSSCLYGFATNKLIRSTLLEKIRFPYYWYEDTIFKLIVHSLTDRVTAISDVTYCYRQNESGFSFSNQVSVINIDTIYVFEWATKYIVANKLDINKDYLIKVWPSQILMNHKRIWWMKKEIRLCAFSIVCEMYRLMFEADGNIDKYSEVDDIIEAIKNRDFFEYEKILFEKL